MRKNNILENLSKSQQEQLRDWLDTMTYREAKERLAKPPPDGFGLRICLASIGRYYVRVRSQEHLDHHAETLDKARSISETAQDPQLLEEASFKLIRERFFSAALSPLTPTQELTRLFSILLKLREGSRHDRKTKAIEEQAGHNSSSEDAEFRKRFFSSLDQTYTEQLEDPDFSTFP